jgi:phage gp36-like protein
MYCSIEDITEHLIPRDQFVQLLDDEKEGEENTRIEQRFDRLVESVSSDIDAQLQDKYTVPFNPVPKIINLIARKLVAYALWMRRSGGVPENITSERDSAERLMTRLINRAITIGQDGEESPMKTGAPPRVSKTERDRVFRFGPGFDGERYPGSDLP